MTFESFSYTLIGQDVKLRKKSSDLFFLPLFLRASNISLKIYAILGALRTSNFYFKASST